MVYYGNDFSLGILFVYPTISATHPSTSPPPIPRPTPPTSSQTFFPTSAPTTTNDTLACFLACFSMSILPPQDLLTLRHSDIVSNIEDKMDSMKSATGLGSNTDDASLKSGEEPVSGQKGQGTAEEPYDQGNAEGELVS